MKTIWQDLNSPVPKINRIWIRVPLALMAICISSPLIIIAGITGGLIDGLIESYKLSVVLICGDDNEQ